MLPAKTFIVQKVYSVTKLGYFKSKKLKTELFLDPAPPPLAPLQ